MSSDTIPTQWKEFWEPVSTPPDLLVHYTSPECLQGILQTGHIRPHDPAPRDWHGLQAVFMCNVRDPTYAARFRELLTAHFHERSRDIYAIYIRPPGPLYRCTMENRRSYYISLSPIPTSAIADHHPFSCRVPQNNERAAAFVNDTVPSMA